MRAESLDCPSLEKARQLIFHDLSNDDGPRIPQIKVMDLRITPNYRAWASPLRIL